MKRVLTFTLSVLLVMALLVGCAGTIVVIEDCTCPTNGNNNLKPSQPVGEGAVKTGLAVVTSVSDSTSATATEDGAIKYDVTIVAVNVDDKGMITACRIDSVPATVKISAKGQILTDLNTAIPTKNELGADYGMVAWGGAIAEWDAQAAAFGAYVTGKTADQVAGIAASPETGLFLVLSKYPLGMIISAVVLLLICTFFITSANSGTFVLGMLSSEGNLNPSNVKKILWGVIQSVLAVALLMAGGLKPLQTISIAAAFLFIFIMIAMMVAVVKALAKDKETPNVGDPDFVPPEGSPEA
jgi:hypothetical protein